MQTHLGSKSSKDGKDTKVDESKSKDDTKSKSGEEDDSAVAKLNKRLDALEAENATLKRGNKQGDLRRTVEREAAKLNFIDADDAWSIGKFGDILEELVDDKGNADEDAIVEALEVLAEAKPHLIKRSKRKSSDDDDDEEDEDEEEEPRKTKRSSSNTNPPRGGSSNGVGTVTKKKREEFDKRFPHLARLRKQRNL
jgi:hypothetical protein